MNYTIVFQNKHKNQLFLFFVLFSVTKITVVWKNKQTKSLYKILGWNIETSTKSE